MKKIKKWIGILLITLLVAIPTLTKAIEEEIWTNPEVIWQYIGELVAGSGATNGGKALLIKGEDISTGGRQWRCNANGDI